MNVEFVIVTKMGHATVAVLKKFMHANLKINDFIFPTAYSGNACATTKKVGCFLGLNLSCVLYVWVLTQQMSANNNSAQAQTVG